MNLDIFKKGLKPVTSLEMFTRSGDYHTEGLFSEIIFGPEESQGRTTTYSYIDLHYDFIHPTAMNILLRLDRKIEKMISTESSFSVINGAFVEDPNGETGLSNFIKMFPHIVFRGETPARDKFIKLLKTVYSEGKLFISIIPVIPPNFRPAYIDEDGKRVIDELNNIYISLMRRASQLRSAGQGALHDLLRFGLQNAVLDHDKYIRSRIEKKSGLIRGQLLGKRTDFSARGVVSPGPGLKVNQVGIPFRMAVKLFEPFLIHNLLYAGRSKDELNAELKKYIKLPASVDSVQRTIKAIYNNDKIPPALYKIFYDATELSMKDRVVLMKRDPVLQTLSYRAFHPVLIEGSVLQLGTTHTSGFNADFDGDSILGIVSLKIDDKETSHDMKDLEFSNLFIHRETTEKNEKIITKFDPVKDVSIKAIDPNTGVSEFKKITEYSKHENLKMFKIEDSKERFKTFWSSEDHSLLVYDENKKIIEKISPVELINNTHGKYLIKDRR